MQTKLRKPYRLRAHNQYITFIVMFGFIGFALILFALTYPIILRKASIDFFFIMFIIIAAVSMLNEDTFETQIGISFFSFFYTLYLFGKEKINTE